MGRLAPIFGLVPLSGDVMFDSPAAGVVVE
jgi:hypothetical protein